MTGNQRRVANGIFILLLLLAAFLRFYRLDEIPPGVTHDEADTGYFFAAVYRGARSPVEAPYGYAYEPLPMYTGAIFMHLFGPTDFALRVHSAFFGLLLMLFTYLWGRRAFGPAVGLGGAALTGLSFWTVSDSRFALNSQPAPALFAGAVYALWLAWADGDGRRRRWAWVLFALLLAGSLYVYEAARSAAGAFVLLLIYLACFDRARCRRHGAWFAGALLLAGLLSAPHLLDPGAWGRTSTLSGPLQAAANGDLGPLWENVLSGLGTISFEGDSFVTYNLPGRPIFDPVVSLFFYVGLLVCIRRWRRSPYAFTLIWLALGLLPTLVLGEYTSTLHSKLAEPPIMMLPALGAVALVRWIERRFGPRWARRLMVGCAMWLPVVALSTGYDYFVRWGEAPATRAAYFHTLAAITDHLEETTYSGPVTISSPFPDLPLDPLIAELRVQRDNLSLRWCDARRAILFPDAERGLLVLPPNVPLDPLLAERLPLRLIERVHLRPDDVDPYFDLFAWDPQAALAPFLDAPAGVTTAGGEALRLPVSLGGAVDLAAYRVHPAPTVRPGEAVTLVTTWRVRDPAALGPPPAHDYGHEAVIFVHLLDPASAVIGQDDRLDAPAWNWRAGDGFVQLHRIPVPIDAKPGIYPVEIGLYLREGLTRLPVVVDGEPAGDALFLQPLEVAGEWE